MDIITYTNITRYTTIFFFSFFVYHSINGFLNYYNLKDRSTLWYTLMSVASAFYCLFFTVNTHVLDIKNSNIILNSLWIFAFCAFYAYMHAIEAFFGSSTKMIKYIKVYILSLGIFQILSLISYAFFDYSFMFSPQSQIKDSLFYQSTNIAISPNLIGNLVGGSAALCVFYVSFVIWREISKRNLEEYLLRIGVIFNILVVLNDTFISLEVSGSLIPIYYFANAFEALRFNLHFLKKAHRKMYNLESEVVHLSKVAQFGYAAASIAHDIKNHVFVMKVKIDKLIKGRYSTTDKVYEDLKKYNEGILEITDLYMNIFKNNISSQKEELDFNEILKDVRGLILPKFENTNVRFLEETKNFKIFCNKAEMVICLVNLIKNSLEEVKEKKDNPWVLLKSDIEKNKILVVDSGDGVDQKQAEQIFKFGYTGKKSGGHGVGLAITNELLQRSGFSLKLEKGCKNTTFSINC